MRRLVLLRHAKAAPAEEYDLDHDRPLTENGRQTASKVGEWLEMEGIVPDLVLCSPAQRTRETWQAAAEAFEPVPPVIHDDQIYQAGPQDLLEVIRNVDSEVQTLLLVGHNPGVETLTSLLAESAQPEVADRFEKKFPTAAVAVLDFEEVPWAAVDEKQAWLTIFETPKHLGFKE